MKWKAEESGVNTHKEHRRNQFLLNWEEGETISAREILFYKNENEKKKWERLKSQLSTLLLTNSDFIILIQADSKLSESDLNYYLELGLAEAIEHDADMLFADVQWLNSAVRESRNLIWTEDLRGFAFVVIFDKAFSRIIDTPIDVITSFEKMLTAVSNKKLVLYPVDLPISPESRHQHMGIENQASFSISELIKNLESVIEFYSKSQINKINGFDQDISVPTYVINLQERTDRREHILKEFSQRTEFDLIIVSACKHSRGAVGLWQSIRNIIILALENDDDVIVICEDDHKFTEHYSRDVFSETLLQAHYQGVEILLGGIGGFGVVQPLTRKSFWVSSFYSTQFMVLYRPIFSKILEVEFGEFDTADGILSDVTSNKVAFFPFISVQKDFGYSDVTALNNCTLGLVDKLFADTSARLEKIYNRHY